MFCIIVGTRPEIIKMSPIIRECMNRDIEINIVHTGQHFSYNMDKIFFEDLNLPEPDYKLEIGEKCKTHGEQTGKMVMGIEKILTKEGPDVVLVEGDTTTVLAGALAAVKLHIKVGHVEAGLRSFDRNMPEEINRILTDHCSDFLFAPTEISKRNLLREGIHEDNIFVTGNTIVDAVYQNIQIAEKKSKILNDSHLTKQGYILVTAHRQENVDNKERFKGIVDGITSIDFPMIYPIHPRAKKMAKRFGLLGEMENARNVKLIEPTGYLDFLMLLANAKAVLTDSGGLQEEACILKVPCLTLRDNTERQETLEVGTNFLVGTKPKKIIRMSENILNKKFEKAMRETINPFGDGKANLKIIKILVDNINKGI